LCGPVRCSDRLEWKQRKDCDSWQRAGDEHHTPSPGVAFRLSVAKFTALSAHNIRKYLEPL
jgi:hypothetical protein